MANINVYFNDVDYQIDESALSTATTALKTHLSTVMNGTGATINLGGTTYNIDSTKLSAATNAFITHLGTIAGSGKKVVVNGVEYYVSSDKVAGAVSELHTVLGGLKSDFEEPQKNEYGFYYNVPYVAEFSNGTKSALVFYEDGKKNVFNSPYSTSAGALDFYASTYDFGNYAYNEEINAITSGSYSYMLSEDGKSLVLNTNGVFIERDGTVYTMSGISHGMYFGHEYVTQNGDTIVADENGTVTFTISGITEVITNWDIGLKGYSWFNSGSYNSDGVCYEIRVSLDGKTLYAYGNNYRSIFTLVESSSDNNNEHTEVIRLDEAILENGILD